jgi:DNA-directed RNA polymerase specialized sigma24 family protein
MLERHIWRGAELDEEISPEQSLLDEEQSRLDDEHCQILQRILNELSPKLRTALSLRFWDGLSYKQMVEWYQRERDTSFNERTMRRHVAEAIAECRKQLLTAEEARK